MCLLSFMPFIYKLKGNIRVFAVIYLCIRVIYKLKGNIRVFAVIYAVHIQVKG